MRPATVVIILSLFAVCGADGGTSENKCVTLGRKLSPSPKWSPAEPDYKIKCCPDLLSVSEPKDCLAGAAPGAVICAKCGDQVCDPKFENNCNCPQDCTR